MKIAPVARALRAQGTFDVSIVHTGQHYDREMSDVFFEQLGIPAPDVHLGAGGGTHGAQTARVLEAFEALLLARRNSAVGVVVVGDVNSTVAAALAAVKLGIPIAHVEAGLRSFDRSMPEEINRVVTDAVADLLLVTEESGRENLRREGVAEERIHLVGNVMIDTLLRELDAARETEMPRRLGVVPRRFAYVTLHRPSNVDDPRKLGQLVAVLLDIAERMPVVFPIHPRTRERLGAFGLFDRLAARAIVTEPLPYRESLSLIDAAAAVLTDSGGIQEETSVLGVPCLTLRPNTERPVTIELGTNTLIGGDLSRVVPLVDDIAAGRYKSGRPIPMWDGSAAGRISDVLAAHWSKEPS